MKYYDKLVFELSSEGRIGHNLPINEFEDVLLPSELLSLTDRELQGL